jgi:TPR repeat protein
MKIYSFHTHLTIILFSFNIDLILKKESILMFHDFYQFLSYYTDNIIAIISGSFVGYTLVKLYSRKKTPKKIILPAVKPKFDCSFDALVTLANNGDALAQCELGLRYYKGDNILQNYKQAYEWFMKAANQNDAEAIYYIGMIYLWGKAGQKRSNPKALRWLLKSAEMGYDVAQLQVGALRESGRGKKADVIEAGNWYLKAAENGNAEAQYIMGEILSSGNDPHYEYAELLLLSSAEQNNTKAQRLLAYLYTEGAGYSRNLKEAYKWTKRAAENWDKAAFCSLGILYQYGKGVQKNYEKAFYWYKMAADMNLPEGQYHLGIMYQEGLHVPKDPVESKKWFDLSKIPPNQEGLWRRSSSVKRWW